MAGYRFPAAGVDQSGLSLDWSAALYRLCASDSRHSFRGALKGCTPIPIYDQQQNSDQDQLATPRSAAGSQLNVTDGMAARTRKWVVEAIVKAALTRRPLAWLRRTISPGSRSGWR